MEAMSRGQPGGEKHSQARPAFQRNMFPSCIALFIMKHSSARERIFPAKGSRTMKSNHQGPRESKSMWQSKSHGQCPGCARLLRLGVVLPLLFALGISAGWAAKIVLKNGMVIEGLILDEVPEEYIVVRTSETELLLRWNRVLSVDRETTHAVEEQLGDQMLRQGRLDEALAYYRAAQKSKRAGPAILDKINQIKQQTEARDLAQYGAEIRGIESMLNAGRYAEAQARLEMLRQAATLETVRERATTLQARLHYLRAQRAMDIIDYRTAQRELAKAIELDPEFAPSHVEMGDLFNRRQLGKTNAIESYQRGLELGRAQLDLREKNRIRWNIAQLSQDLGLWRQTVEYCKEIYDSNPRFNPRLIELMMSAFQRQATELSEKQPEEAVALLREALTYQPGETTIRFQLARLLADKGLFDEAYREATELLNRDERYPSAHYLAGNCLIQQGKVLDARGHLLAEIRLNPNHYDSLCDLGELSVQGGDITAAETYFSRAMEVDPSRYRSLLGMAKVKRRQGNRVEARQLVKRVLDVDPKNRAANLEMGSVLKEEKSYSEARKFFDQVIKDLDAEGDMLNPEDKQLLADALNRRGEIFILLEQPRTARNDFEKALTHSPNLGLTYFNLGQSYLKEGGGVEALKKAEENYKTARKLQPDSPEFAQGLGILYHQHMSQRETNATRKRQYLQLAIANYRDYLKAGGADSENVKKWIEECGGTAEDK
jgi:tetratricopeptide (TPR) repeat protein